jgi:hypothetical protein
LVYVGFRTQSLFSRCSFSFCLRFVFVVVASYLTWPSLYRFNTQYNPHLPRPLYLPGNTPPYEGTAVLTSERFSLIEHYCDVSSSLVHPGVLTPIVGGVDSIMDLIRYHCHERRSLEMLVEFMQPATMDLTACNNDDVTMSPLSSYLKDYRKAYCDEDMMDVDDEDDELFYEPDDDVPDQEAMIDLSMPMFTRGAPRVHWIELTKTTPEPVYATSDMDVDELGHSLLSSDDDREMANMDAWSHPKTEHTLLDGDQDHMDTIDLRDDDADASLVDVESSPSFPLHPIVSTAAFQKEGSVYDLYAQRRPSPIRGVRRASFML